MQQNECKKVTTFFAAVFAFSIVFVLLPYLEDREAEQKRELELQRLQNTHWYHDVDLM